MIEKLGFDIESLLYFKMIYEAPNRLILDFKLEKDIYEKDNIKKRRLISIENVKNVADPAMK